MDNLQVIETPERPRRDRPGTAWSLALALLLAAVLVLTACGRGGVASGLRQAGIVGQPDEFMVLPTRPLEMPPSLATLPPPAPGTRDRAAYVPQQEAMTALAGRPPAASPGAPGLVASVGPADPGIRAALAQEDAAYRQGNRPPLLERWFRRDRDRLVYRGATLDADSEWERLRRSGVRVPAAPPLP